MISCHQTTGRLKELSAKKGASTLLQNSRYLTDNFGNVHQRIRDAAQGHAEDQNYMGQQFQNRLDSLEDSKSTRKIQETWQTIAILEERHKHGGWRCALFLYELFFSVGIRLPNRLEWRSDDIERKTVYWRTVALKAAPRRYFDKVDRSALNHWQTIKQRRFRLPVDR